MNKILVYAVGVLGILLTIFFFLWRNTSIKNTQLCEINSQLTEQLTSMQKIIAEKEQTIAQQNQHYQEILNSIEYNECENLPVSTNLVKAAKELQK